jgi:hypothetical protein
MIRYILGFVVIWLTVMLVFGFVFMINDLIKELEIIKELKYNEKLRSFLKITGILALVIFFAIKIWG